MAAEQLLTAPQYVQHHLHHWQKNFALQSVQQQDIVDFSIFNLDSVLWAVIAAALCCWVMWKAAHKATSGVPGRLQAAIEVMAEIAEKESKIVIHSATSRKLVAPLGMSVFLWIFIMNAYDLLPVDLIPHLWEKSAQAAGHNEAYFRIVPTADLSTTLGLSVSVLLMCIFYSLKIKGGAGWVKELFTAPFGSFPLLWPFNFLMQIIEFVAKTVSHAMRLFGNMFAGELVFMLIAMMGGVWAWQFNPLSGGFWLAIGHIVAGSAWAIFHILIITLQAFIFAILAVIYLGQAHESH